MPIPASLHGLPLVIGWVVRDGLSGRANPLLALPFGARVDMHPSVDGPVPTTVIVSAQVDIATLVIGGFFYAVMRGMSH